MDLYIDREELGRGLARVQNVVERRSTQQVLSHALLVARDGSLRVTATDTEVAFIGDLAANVSRPGQLAVDAANLFQVVRSLPEPTVQLVGIGGNRLEVRSGRVNFKLPGLPAEEYPPLPAFDATGTATVAGDELRRLVEQTSFAVATDDVRYGLNGVHVEQVTGPEGPRLRMVATDGHRLAAAECAFEGKIAISPRMLIPRKALAVLRKLLEGDEPMELAFGTGAIRLSRLPGAAGAHGGQTFWFRLLDGEFPDYRAVVPTEGQHRVVVDREAIASVLRRVGILVQDRARAVRFAFGEGELEVDVANADRGEIRETLPIELEGKPLTVGFNARYLGEVLGAARGDRLSLELAHPLAPCLVKGVGDDRAFFIVMPMRLD
jgi:DNA polymerase III subunit beta